MPLRDPTEPNEEQISDSSYTTEDNNVSDSSFATEDET